MDDSARAFRTLVHVLGGGLLALFLTPGATARQAEGPGEEGAGAALEARATALLASENPLDQARGAWLVGAGHLDNQVPRILGLLVEEASREVSPTAEEARLRLGLLDALLQLDAPLPVELADEAWKLNPLLTLILVSRDPARHLIFLEGRLGGERDDETWVAVRNMLLRERSPRLAPALLEGRTETQRLEVHGPGNLAMSVGCGGAHSCGGGSFGVQGFPDLPSVVYRATLKETPGAVVLAPGKRSVYYVRRVYPAGVVHGGGRRGGHGPETREGMTLDYLREMAPKRLTSFLGGRTHYFEWSEPSVLRGEMQAKVQEVRGQRADFLAHLCEKGWLDRKLPMDGFAQLSFERVDRRSDRSEPLPELDELD